MARILAIGVATLDIVFDLDRYPVEDEEVRAADLRICRGGNASNTAGVLARLGHACAFGGVLADAPESGVILDDFARLNIDISACRTRPGRPPTSSIQLACATGSRTIVHYRDLPEYGFGDFARVDLMGFDWLHFEGRNVPDLLRMLERARAERPDLPISLETEKPRPGIEAALPLADLLLCSRGFAQSRGFGEPAAFLRDLRKLAPQADLVAAWGEEGAYGLDRDGRQCASPAFPPETVRDTLGAGDTFNAGVIDAQVRGLPLAAALEHGCRLAGAKCGMAGFDGLAVLTPPCRDV